MAGTEVRYGSIDFDPARLQAQHDHREKAIADTYASILRPRIDMLTLSLVEEVPS